MTGETEDFYSGRSGDSSTGVDMTQVADVNKPMSKPHCRLANCMPQNRGLSWKSSDVNLHLWFCAIEAITWRVRSGRPTA